MPAPHEGLFETLKAAGPSRADAVRRIEVLANLLDSAFAIPGTRYRIGLDSIIGIVPGIGDAVTTLLSSYIIWEARQLGVPKRLIARMIGNVAIDSAIGLIPFAGDAFDVVFKANRRNIKILRDYLARNGETSTLAAAGRAGIKGDVIDAEYQVVGGRK